jgi:D-alanine-D-alanine ligase
MSKLRVAVLRGGPSSEYYISLKSGAHVLQQLPEKYQPLDIFISRDGTWHREGFERTPDKALQNVDVVFNALHGQYGEDGKVQKILEHLGIPFTGSAAFPSSMAMNKVLLKKAFETHKFKSPYFKVIRNTDNPKEVVNHAFHHFLLPIVVKPATSGSSLGVTIVKSFNTIEAALQEAFKHSDTAIMEEYIRGTEASVGVLENFRGEKLYTLLPVQIIHPGEHDYYSFDAKYTSTDRERYPGNFSQEEKEQLQILARRIHDILGLRHYSKTDFIVTPRRGIYVLETNSQPSLVQDTLMPKSLEAIGCNFPTFLDHVIMLAMERK